MISFDIIFSRDYYQVEKKKKEKRVRRKIGKGEQEAAFTNIGLIGMEEH